MICVTVNALGNVVVNGSPPCASGSLVVFSEMEFASKVASPWSLSLSEGGLIAASILGVWATAFVFRMLVRAVLSDGSPER